MRLDGWPLLVEEIAYEQWHRMLFARFLAENGLLLHPPSSLPRARAVAAMWKRGRFVTAETERFLVFSRTPLAELELREVSVPSEYAEALWRLPAQGSRSSHPHESPVSVVRRFIEEYTELGELVVDPFCGHGNVVLTAVELGRHGVGYDIDAECIAAAEAKLRRAVPAGDSDEH